MSLKKALKDQCDSCCNNKTNKGGGANSCAVYGIGLFGAAFYFFSHAVGFTGYIMAFFKTIVWPALLVYQALMLLKI